MTPGPVIGFVMDFVVFHVCKEKNIFQKVFSGKQSFQNIIQCMGSSWDKMSDRIIL